MTAAIQTSLPPPVNAAFTGGELMLTTATGDVPAGTYHFARKMYLPTGTYTLRCWADDVATFWIGTEVAGSRRIGVHSKSNTPSVFTFYIQAGMYRFDVTLVNLGVPTYTVTVPGLPGPAPMGFAMSLSKEGETVYTSAADKWVWGGSPVSDGALPSVGDTRTYLPVWSVRPNWGSGITERIDYLTEVMVSETSIEQRRSLRRYPRRSIEASFLRSGVDRQRIDNFIAGVGGGQFLVPLWFEQLKIPNNLSGTTINFPTGTLAQREFFTGDVVLLSGGDSAVYDVRIITVSGDTITLDAAPSRTWPAATRITPLRVARFSEAPQSRMVTDRLGETQVRFSFDEPEKNIVPSWGYCSPLWRFKPDRVQPIQIDHSRALYSFDVDTGKVFVTDPGGRDRVGVRADLKLFGRAQLWAFRSFLAQARGRSQRFWWPSGTHDIEPVGAIGGLTLDARDSGYATFMTYPQDARLMIGVTFTDGRPPVYRRIQTVQNLGTFERFTLTQAMPIVNRREIERIMFMLPVRFDQDGFELHHVTDEAKAVLASVAVRSSDIEGMPDIDCWVTSWPYPIYEFEEMQVSATVLGGAFGGIPAIAEGMDMSATVTGGSFPLVVVYKTYDSPDPEAMDMSATVTGGSFPLVVGYKTYDSPDPEAMDMSATVTGGTLVNQLITTAMDPEAMQMGATVTGGTLS